MRSISGTNQTILTDAASGKRIKTLAWLDVKDINGVWTNQVANIRKATVRKTRDTPVATLSIELFTKNTGTPSPLLNGSPPVTYGSEVKFRIELVDGSGTSRWGLLFHGHVEKFSYGDSYMTLLCQDYFGRFMKRYTEGPRKYGTTGGKQLHLVMQDIITEWMPGWTLDTPHGTPSHTIKTREFLEGSVGQMLRDLALEIGWDVEYRWKNDGSDYGAFYLSLIDPGRANVTNLYTFEPGTYREIPDLAQDGSSVRNKIQVPYVENGVRGVVTAQASSPTLTFQGVLYARLGENGNFKFTSQAAAQAAADTALADVQEAPLSGSFKTHYFYAVELDDRYQFKKPVAAWNNLQFNSDQSLVVTGFQHDWEMDSRGDVYCSTTLEVRGKATAGSERWAQHFSPVEGPGFGDVTAPDAVTGLTGDFTTPNAILSWNGVENAIGYKVTLTTLNATRRIDYPTSPYYEYTLEANKADHVSPVGSLSFEVRALKMVEGAQLVSSPTVQALSNAAPPQPTSLVVLSASNHIIVSVAQPTFGDYLETQVEVSTVSNFSSIHERYKGTAYAGLRLTVAGSGLHYVRVRFVDVFNQASDWTTSQVEAVLIDGGAIGSVSFAQLLGQILEGQIGSNIISADALKAEAVLARHLGIGNTVNSFPDPKLKDLGNWDLHDAWTKTESAGETYFANSALISAGVGADHDARTMFFDVLPNTPYALSFKTTWGGTGSLEVYWEDGINAGTLIGTFTQASTIFGGVFTTPAKTRIRLLFRRKNTGSLSLMFGNIVVTQRFGGNFILDGDAIVSRDIQAGGKITTGTAGNLRAELGSGGLTVYDASNNHKVVVGNIGGRTWGSGTLSSSPATWGIWGGRNAGVYLADYPLIIGHASKSWGSNNNPSIAAGASGDLTAYSTDIDFTDYAVANGRKLIVFRPVISVASLNDGLVIQYFNITAEMHNGTTWVANEEWTNGTYTKARLYMLIRVKNTTGSTINPASGSVVANVLIMDVPSLL